MGASLRACDGVHLVEDQRLDGLQGLARLRGEEQEQRLRRRDQDVGSLAAHGRPLFGRSVAGADSDPERAAKAGERPAQVALDVVLERLQR